MHQTWWRLCDWFFVLLNRFCVILVFFWLEIHFWNELIKHIIFLFLWDFFYNFFCLLDVADGWNVSVFTAATFYLFQVHALVDPSSLRSERCKSHFLFNKHFLLLTLTTHLATTRPRRMLKSIQHFNLDTICKTILSH